MCLDIEQFEYMSYTKHVQKSIILYSITRLIPKWVSCNLDYQL